MIAKFAALAALTAFLTLAHAQNVHEVPPVQFRTHQGFPLFDFRGPPGLTAAAVADETERFRWLALVHLVSQPNTLENPQAALVYARHFLPSAVLDQYFFCTVKVPCSERYANVSIPERVNGNISKGLSPIVYEFKGDEFEKERAHKRFISEFQSKLVSMAAKLPQEVYIASASALSQYNNQTNAFQFNYGTGFGNRSIYLHSRFCASSEARFPIQLIRRPPEAESLARSLPNDRAVTLLLKVKLTSVMTKDMVNTTGSACNSTASISSLQMFAGSSLDKLIERFNVETVALAKLPQGVNRPSSNQSVQIPKDVNPSEFEVLGIRLGTSMQEAERIVRAHMPVSMVYETLNVGRSSGYPEGKYYVSLDQKEVISLFTGPQTAGKVNAVVRRVLADGMDLQDVARKFAERYPQPGNPNDSSCGVKPPASWVKRTFTRVEGGDAKNAQEQMVLSNLLPKNPGIHAIPNAPNQRKCSAIVTFGFSDKKGEVPYAIFGLWDNSKASFDTEENKSEATTVPTKTLKF